MKSGALVHQQMAKYELQGVRKYAEMLERLLAAEAEEFNSNLNIAMSGLALEEQDEKFIDYMDDHRQITLEYPNEMRLGLVSTVYSLFEVRTSKVATALLKTVNSPLVLRDFAGNSDFNKFKTAIEKVCRLEMPAAAWDRVDLYREIRNRIVHSAGRFDKKPPEGKLKLFIDESPNIHVDDNMNIWIKPAFLEELISDIAAFYAVLFDSWRTWKEIRPITK